MGLYVDRTRPVVNATCTDTCAWDLCDLTRATTARLIAIDTERENRMGLGRSWPVRGALAPGDVALSQSLANALGVAEGDSLVVYA